MIKSIAAFFMLPVAAMMLSGCIFPCWVDDGPGYRRGHDNGGGHGQGHRDGGGRY